MTIDEAIKHCEEVAEEQKAQAWEAQLQEEYRTIKSCKECAAEHIQLAEWLKDYKRLKEQEPCEDAISRKRTMLRVREFIGNQTYTEKMLVDDLNALPSVAPQPKTGHWIDDVFGSKCSYCGLHTHLDKFGRPMKFKYCSMCGTKMVEPQESEDKK